jgi:hypothetical protein
MYPFSTPRLHHYLALVHKNSARLTSGHQVRADQHPDVSRAEAAYHVFALGGAALGVHDVHVDAVVN